MKLSNLFLGIIFYFISSFCLADPSLHKAIKRAGFKEGDFYFKEAKDLIKNNKKALLFINKDGQTVIHQATRYDQVELLELILEKKQIDVDAKDKQGRSALHWASWYDHKDIAKKLIKQGANLNIRDGSGKSPLHLAAWGAHLDLVNLLTFKGASVKIKDWGGRTALHEASLNPQVPVVKKLIEKGSELEAKDRLGNTAAYYASKKRNLFVLKLLIAENTDLFTENKKGESPYTELKNQMKKDPYFEERARVLLKGTQRTNRLKKVKADPLYLIKKQLKKFK